MDQWCRDYLREWQDLQAPEESLQFIRHVLTELKNVSEKDEDEITTINAVASSIAAKVNSQPEHTAKDFLQRYNGIVFSAATSSHLPLNPSDLADITCLLAKEVPPQLAQRFRVEFTWYAWEDWEGDVDLDKEEERDRSKQIQDWVAFHEFCAHLARTQTAPDMEKIGSSTLELAFGHLPRKLPPDMIDFYLPAATAWIRILGKEFRHWCVNEATLDEVMKKDFNKKKWDTWREDFEGCSKSETLQPELKQMAETAWQTMCNLEKLES